jgi:amidohydrolase
MRVRSALVRIAALIGAAAAAAAAPNSADQAVPEIAALEPELEALYRDLHQHPELAFQEKRTAAALATRVGALGYEVTTGIAQTGIVAILHSGPGPVVMLRTELDALPVEEKTGLPYASKVTVLDANGATVPVAHACGHDLHMAAWYGTAKIMAARRSRWHGTLMLIGQPAEEAGDGAAAMLSSGLFTRFPKPNYAIGMHDEPGLPSGQVGYHAGFFRAAFDLLEVTIHGRGGHGAHPQNAIDPIVIAARSVLGLQTIVSRETDPLSPAVVTVGAIHGGSVGNIIPDEVHMLISVRSYESKVREHILASITRQLNAEAVAAGATEMPSVKITSSSDAVYNEPALTARLVAALHSALGLNSAIEIPQQMTSEDFSQYGRAGVPSVLLHIGAVSPATLASGRPHPDLHSPEWAPELEPTLRSMVRAEVVMLTELLTTRRSGT